MSWEEEQQKSRHNDKINEIKLSNDYRANQSHLYEQRRGSASLFTRLLGNLIVLLAIGGVIALGMWFQ